MVVTAQDGTTTATTTVSVTRAEAMVDIEITQAYRLSIPPASSQTRDQAALTVPASHLTLIVTVSNRGPDSATDLSLIDTFPSVAADSIWSWTCTATGGAACGAASGTGNLNERLRTLPMGGAVTFTVVGTLDTPARWSNTISTALSAGIVNSGAGRSTLMVGAYRVMLPIILR